MGVKVEKLKNAADQQLKPEALPKRHLLKNQNHLPRKLKPQRKKHRKRLLPKKSHQSQKFGFSQIEELSIMSFIMVSNTESNLSQFTTSKIFNQFLNLKWNKLKKTKMHDKQL